jgi:hypothetical protein
MAIFLEKQLQKTSLNFRVMTGVAMVSVPLAITLLLVFLLLFSMSIALIFLLFVLFSFKWTIFD